MIIIVIFFAVGTCFYLCVEYLGLWLGSIVFYGKIAKKPIGASWLTIPKTRFKDMYTTGLICVLLVYAEVMHSLILGGKIPEKNLRVLDIFSGVDNGIEGRQLETFVGLTLMLVQLLRRFYETHFMQVFSKAGQLNTIFYMTTLVYYPILIVGVRVNGSAFARDSNGVNVIWTDILNPRILTGLTIFVFSWWNQFQSNRILVNLRKDSSGKVITDQHFLPVGGFFDLVSSPHMFFEVLIYVALTLVMPTNPCVLLNLLFVTTNQCLYAKTTHKYYKTKFPEYPSNRKIIIPFIY